MPFTAKIGRFLQIGICCGQASEILRVLFVPEPLED